MNILLSSAYLAPVQYFSKLVSSQEVYIEQNENYIKQTYRNRCSILSANGVMNLSIPIESLGGAKCLVRDIYIAEHGNWQHLHWNALVSAYNSTPFFEYYRDYFEPFYERKYKYLFDFNEQLREMICHLLDIDTSNTHYTKEYMVEPADNIQDYRTLISPKLSLDLDNHFCAEPYYQVFDNRFGFQPNLSIVDLLFNMGNESLIVLNKSNKKAF